MDAQGGGLFRPQVMKRASGRLQGEVLVHPRLSHVLLTAGCLLWIALIAYFAGRAEWAVNENVPGLIEPDAASRLRGTVFVPVHARQYIQEGLVFDAAIEGLATSSPLRVRVAQISDELTTSCPACDGSRQGSLYVRASVDLLDEHVRVDDRLLGLRSGVRFHFALPAGKQSLLEWLGFTPLHGGPS